MRIERDARGAGPVIRGFTGDGFRIDGDVYRAALLSPDGVAEWSPPPLSELDPGALDPVLLPGIEFVLLGTGPALARPPRALVDALARRDLGLETMDSRAAARAWGVLRGEGRRIAAALYPL